MSRRRGGRAAAEPQAREPAEHDGSDLPDGTADEDHGEHGRDRDAGTLAVRRQSPRHSPDRLRDDGDGHHLEPMDHAGADRALEDGGAIGEGEQDQSRGQGECRPGGERAERAAAQETERESDLARGGTGQELAERDQIGIARVVDPAPAHDQLVAKIAEIRDRPAERGEPELQECQEHLECGPGSVLLRAGRAIPDDPFGLCHESAALTTSRRQFTHLPVRTARPGCRTDPPGGSVCLLSPPQSRCGNGFPSPALLLYRYRRLGEARAAARSAGFQGAMFPWQSGSDGQEETQELNLNHRSHAGCPTILHAAPRGQRHRL